MSVFAKKALSFLVFFLAVLLITLTFPVISIAAQEPLVDPEEDGIEGAVKLTPEQEEALSRQADRTPRVSSSSVGGTVILDGKCGSMFLGAFPDLSDIDCYKQFVAGFLTIVQGLFATVTLLGALLFDMSIQYSIFKFPTFANMDAVKLAWAVLRDLANMFFIFILLYIAIGTMLRVGNTGPKAIVSVIIAAILVNFSFAISRVVIDVSNVAAAQFYNVMSGNEARPSMDTSIKSIADDAGSLISNAGTVSLTFLKAVGAADYLGAARADVTYTEIISNGVFGSLFLILAGIILIVGAFMLLIRLVVLVILIILSPLAFLAYAMPGMSGTFNTWLKKLLNQAFFAPAYLLMLLITLKVMTEARADNSLVPGGAVTGIMDAGIGTFVIYVIFSGLMVGAIIVARSMGAVGADHAIGMGRRLGMKAARSLPGLPMRISDNVTSGIAGRLGGNRENWRLFGRAGTAALGAGDRAVAQIGRAGRALGAPGLERTIRGLPLTALDTAGEALGMVPGASGLIPTNAERKAEEKQRLEDAEAAKIDEANRELQSLQRELDSGDAVRVTSAETRSQEIMDGLGTKQRQKLSTEAIQGNRVAAQSLTEDEWKKRRENAEEEGHVQAEQQRAISPTPTRAQYEGDSAAIGSEERARGDAAFADAQNRHRQSMKSVARTMNTRQLRSLTLDQRQNIAGGIESDQAASLLQSQDSDWGGAPADQGANRLDFINRLGARAAKLRPEVLNPHLANLSTDQLINISNNRDSEYWGPEFDTMKRQLEARVNAMTAPSAPPPTAEQQRLYDYLTTNPNGRRWGI